MKAIWILLIWSLGGPVQSLPDQFDSIEACNEKALELKLAFEAKAKSSLTPLLDGTPTPVYHHCIPGTAP